MEIADWRNKIDELDRRLVDLLNERAQAAHEIGNGILGEHKSPIHIIAGIEKHEDVRTRQQGAQLAWRETLRPFTSLAGVLGDGLILRCGRICQSDNVLIALSESRKFLRNSVLGNLEVLRTKTGDIISLSVRHRDIQLHQIHDNVNPLVDGHLGTGRVPE